MSKSVENRLKTPLKVKGLSDRFYKELREAPEKGEKVAWCIGPVPFVPLIAMGIKFAHLENYGARIAARRVAGPIQKIAEDWGLAKDACSYLRGAQGMSLCYAQDISVSPEVEPYRLPKPDMIICMNYCVSAANLAEIFARELKIPVFILDSKFHFEDDPRENYIPYAKRNVRDWIAFLENQAGHSMDYDRFSQAIAYARETAFLKREVLNMGKNIPSPITAFDALISMGGGMLWAGQPESVEYMKQLKEEVEQRVKDKVAAIPNEKIRLMWDFIMVWPKVGHLAKLFASYRANVVYAPYSAVAQGYSPETLDPENPIEAIATELTHVSTLMNVDYRIRSYVKAVEEFSIDGIVGHSPKTCRKIPIGQPVYLDHIARKTGVQTMIFEADHSDPDFYAAASIDTRIEAFLETIDARKSRAGV